MPGLKKVLAVLCVVVVAFLGCRGKGVETADGKARIKRAIAVYVPGTTSGSPTYEMLVEGVLRAASEYSGVVATVVEAGYNQTSWEEKLTSLAADGKYDLIVSSNPSLPALALSVQQKFPNQRFLLLDGSLEPGNPSIYALQYNQREEAYMAGYLAALVAGESGGNKIGLIAAQEYPVMNDVILPGYREGAAAFDPAITVEFRVIGNWFDASKAAELALSMISGGVKAILCIAGGASDGAVQAASETGAKIIWFDSNGYAIRPGVIVGSCVIAQDRAAYIKTKEFLEGTLPFGTVELVGVRDHYVDFIDDDPLYIESLSENVRQKQQIMLEKLRSGELVLD
jgi:simple sugar transport system substrate-binding protein